MQRYIKYLKISPHLDVMGNQTIGDTYIYRYYTSSDVSLEFKLQMYFPTIMNYISYFHVTDLHPSNAYFPISTSALLSITISNFLQPLNASHPIFVTDDGISTLVNPLQPENAPPPISVTDVGISTLVNPLQPENASHPIFVTDDGIFTLVIPLQP